MGKKNVKYGVYVLGDLVSKHSKKAEALKKRDSWRRNANPKYDRKSYATVRKLKRR